MISALTVAAHGLGGGGDPSSTALTLLLTISAAIGAVAASIQRPGPGGLLALLGTGQLAGHLLLGEAVTHDHLAGTLDARQMVLAHAAATVVCAVLVLVAERLHAFLGNLLWAVWNPAPGPLAPVGLSHFSTGARNTGVVDHSPISRRGPPVVPA